MTEEQGLQLLKERVYYFSSKCAQKGRYLEAWKLLRARAQERVQAQIELLERIAEEEAGYY